VGCKTTKYQCQLKVETDESKKERTLKKF